MFKVAISRLGCKKATTGKLPVLWLSLICLDVLRINWNMQEMPH